MTEDLRGQLNKAKAELAKLKADRLSDDEKKSIMKMQDDRARYKAGGAELIAAERQRQIDGEGWTAHHDDRYDHAGRELANAAACYALWSSGVDIRGLWPDGWGFKPSDPIRNLVKAGALIAAEIDRLQRGGNDGETIIRQGAREVADRRARDAEIRTDAMKNIAELAELRSQTATLLALLPVCPTCHGKGTMRYVGNGMPSTKAHYVDGALVSESYERPCTAGCVGGRMTPEQVVAERAELLDLLHRVLLHTDWPDHACAADPHEGPSCTFDEAVSYFRRAVGVSE